jgi:hypothetical protein
VISRALRGSLILVRTPCAAFKNSATVYRQSTPIMNPMGTSELPTHFLACGPTVRTTFPESNQPLAHPMYTPRTFPVVRTRQGETSSRVQTTCDAQIIRSPRDARKDRPRENWLRFFESAKWV